VLYKGHVLMIQRGHNPGKGLLALPGGFVDQGETLKKAAIRELKEETNINFSDEFLEYALKAVKVYDDPWRDQRGRFITHAHFFDFDTTAKFRIKEDLPRVKAGDDASAAIWVSLDELELCCDRIYADHFSILKNLIKG
jgi:bifunctional NMN adenylyltransferase/nudix hydrolase